MCRHCNFSILQQGTQHLGFSPKMRGHGTLKLQDETIDLPYDPLEIAIISTYIPQGISHDGK